MATKDWKRVKSEENYEYLLVYKRKSNKDDTLVLIYKYRWVQYRQYGYSDSIFKKYHVLRNNITLFETNSKDEAIKYIKEYVKKN